MVIFDTPLKVKMMPFSIFPLYMIIFYVIVLINLDLFLVHRREMGERERVTTPSCSHLINEIYFKGIIFAQSILMKLS